VGKREEWMLVLSWDYKPQAESCDILTSHFSSVSVVFFFSLVMIHIMATMTVMHHE
jgi:hypothetical protein